ncbi:MAG TPA: carboxypeptidase regulatory-like domain-containing protein [Kofleriaceae bacterium]|nr:carboxypeptidase regulatory-like domain-containing protein [Kofleriaceae bacterium]
MSRSRSRRMALVGIVLAAVALVLGWRMRHRDTAATGGGSGAEHAGSAAVVAKHGPVVPASLAGRVTRKSDGTAIAGAFVAVAHVELAMSFGHSSEPPLVATTDATGAWTLASVPPGDYAVSATASGFLPGAHAKLAVGSGEHKTGVDLALAAGGTLVSGTISDVGGGTIAGARVAATEQSLRAFTSHAAPALALSDARGHYELSLPDGSYQLAAGHDDYTQSSRSIELAGKPLVIDFALVPGGRIRGQVVARDTGKPVAGAMVVAHTRRLHSGGDGRDATTDADGRFELHGLPSGANTIDASARGYASTTPTTVELGIGEQVDGVRVVVDRARSITGRVVVKGTQQGVPGIEIGAWSIGAESHQAQAPEPSGPDGAFEIVGVRPGNYLLAAMGEGKMPEIGKNVEVADKDVTGVVVEMAPGATLSGRVDPGQVASISIAPAGEIGLANMFEMIKAAFVQADSDATGNFVLEHVPSGKFVLTARTREGPAGKLEIAVTDANQSGLVVALETRASISGKVVDTNGKPVEGTRVAARPSDKDMAVSVAMSQAFGHGAATSGPDGAFKIVGLEPGKYRVESEGLDDFVGVALDNAKAEHEREPIEVAAGAEHTGVVVTVEAKDGVIRGQVNTGDGAPAPDAWVTAHLQPGGDIQSKFEEVAYLSSTTPVLTGPDGKFTIDHLRKQTYTLVVEGPRGASHAERKDVKTGDSVTLTLAPLGTISGHVTQSGAAVPSFDVSCGGPMGRIDRHVDAADGSYSIEHLAPGHYTCDATTDGGNAAGAVDVPAGPATLDLALQPFATIVGTVVSVLDGSPVPGVAAIADADHGGSQQQYVSLMFGNGPMTDPSGHFEIQRVATGTGHVELMAMTSMGKSLATKPYTVTAGQHLDLGTISVVPPRNGDAGTLGMATDVEPTDLAVTTVSAGGPAAAAGIVVGDKIVAIDGHAVTDLTGPVAETIVSSGTLAAGQSVALGLARGTTVTVTAAKW